jgi:hypothetical protein
MIPPQPDSGEIPPAAASDTPGIDTPGVATPPPAYRWYHKFFAVVLATGCLVIGIVLLLFPWTPYWDNNYFAGLSPFWLRLWKNLYLRGAVSGIGMVNLYISLVEVFRLKRFSQR